MKKNVMQDVVPGKRSIRNVEVPSRARAKAEPVITESHIKVRDTTPRAKEIKIEDFTRPVRVERGYKKAQTIEEEIQYQKPPANGRSFTYEYEEPKKSSKKWLYISAGLLVVAIAFGISALFKSATIRVTPKQETDVLNANFTATKDVSGNGLGFQVVTISDNTQETVQATGQQQVTTKAQGMIIIYNGFSTASQKLVATTRFQTPEGLIFRLVSPVTIPGETTSGGKTIAGSVSAVVVADVAGADYNVGLKDFTIPGFKGTAKYTTIYARSKTAMTGGFSGLQKIISPDESAQVDTNLTAQLKTTLAKDIVSQIPANFILYPGSLSYDLNPIGQLDSTTGNAVLQKTGTASAIIFDKSAITSAIFAKISPALASTPAQITNLDSLNFTYATSTGWSSNTNTTVIFTLSGNPHTVWTFDVNKLKSDLLGLSKTDAEKLVATYPSIQEAWIETRPFWNNDIPKDPAKVTLINTLTN